MTSKSKTAVRTTDIPRNRVTVFPIQEATDFRSPAPTACPMETVEPMASPTIITVSMCMTWDPTDTAVVPETPSNCPMMNRSAIPYKVCRK